MNMLHVVCLSLLVSAIFCCPGRAELHSSRLVASSLHYRSHENVVWGDSEKNRQKKYFFDIWERGDQAERQSFVEQSLERQERLINSKNASRRMTKSRSNPPDAFFENQKEQDKMAWMDRKRRLQQQTVNETIGKCLNGTACDNELSHAIEICKNDAAYLELNQEKQYQCSCSKNSIDGVTMNCKSQCGHYCNQYSTIRSGARDVCGREEYDHVYDVDGNVITRTDHFIYTKGINNRLSIVEWDCSVVDGSNLDGLGCNSCSVTVDTTQMCQKCEMRTCNDGNQAAFIDCENIEKGGVFNLCERDSIPVHDGVFSKLSSAGFEQCTDESPDNDICNAKTKLVTPGGSSILGMTNQALIDDVAPCTGTSTSPGLWYRVVGKGSGMAVSTCGSATDFDTQISIYSGSCDSLQCVASNDDTVNEDCGFGQSSVGFFGEVGVMYHIKIHGFGSATGIFELELRETDLAVDECTTMKTRTLSLTPSEQGLECECRPLEDGSQSLQCTDTCTYCSDDDAICLTKALSGLFNQQSTKFTETKTFSYTKGLDHTIEVHELGCTTEGCGGCEVAVDGVACDSCSIQKCNDDSLKETGLVVDCKNFNVEAVFDECSGSSQFDSNIFQALSSDSFQTCKQDPMVACNILAEQTMESSGDERTSCSCKKNTEKSASLICHDDNCRFCNDDTTVCANITYGAIVTGEGPGMDVEYRQYEYVTGRNEVLRFEEDDHGCTFSIDGVLCNSCGKAICQGGEFEGVSVNCSNIDPGAIFTECNADSNGTATGLFEVFSSHEFEQCIEGEDPKETCLRMKKYEETHGFDRNTTCECSSNPISGEYTLTCTDSGCLYCNHFATACATNTYGYRIGRFGEPLSYFDGYKYKNMQGDTNEHVVVEYMNDGCRIHVDDQECTSCDLALCADQVQGRIFQDIRVDCENIEAGASFDSCGTDYEDTGILEVASNDDYRKCIIPQAPKEACLSEASLRENQTTNTHCDCTSNDHGGFNLLCVEEGCLYCSADRQRCGYETTGTVFNRLGYPIESSNGFKFISGIEGHLLFQPLSDPSDPRDCVVSFNEEECTSCEMQQCSAGSNGLKIDCKNIEGGSVIKQCDYEEVDGFLEYLSPQSFLNCMTTMDPMEFCEEQKEFTEVTNRRDRGTICNCRNESGETTLACTDTQCMYCSSDESVCKRNALYGGTISKFGFFTSNMDVSQYVQGRQERIAIEQIPGGSCTVSIDEKRCLSCTEVLCDDESIGLNIDCSNVVEGATHQACQNSNDPGVFALLSDRSFEVCLEYSGSNKDLSQDEVIYRSRSRAHVELELATVWLAVTLAVLL